MATISSTTGSAAQTPFDGAGFDEAQLAAASFLARYSGRTLEAFWGVVRWHPDPPRQDRRLAGTAERCPRRGIITLVEGVQLRDFERRDQDATRRLILEGLRDHWGSIDEALNPDLDDIAASYAAGRTVVALCSGELIGTGTLLPVSPAAAEIRRMSVHAASRRKGVGRAIAHELIDTARRWSLERVILETSSAWTEIVEFYSALGFEITGTRTGDFGEDTWFELTL